MFKLSLVAAATIIFLLTENTATQKKNSTFHALKDTTVKKIIVTDKAPTPIGPYSQAVVAGSMIFISGQVAKDPATGNLITGDIKAETKQVMENLKAILKAGDVDFSHVVKTTVFLTDMKNFASMNEVYGTYFEKDFPARETVQASALPLGVNVEISMIAMK